jgi:hypothetical protein
MDHGLAKRSQRLARAAAIAALVGGQISDAAASDDLFGFCHFAARPGDLVAMDSFYIGNLKGVGKVYQLTAIDTATRWVVMWLILAWSPTRSLCGPWPMPNASSAARPCRSGQC